MSLYSLVSTPGARRFLWGLALLLGLLAPPLAHATGNGLNPPTPQAAAYIIVLDEPPVSQVFAAQQQQGVQAAALAAITQAHLAQVEAAQQRLLPALVELGVEVIYRNQRVYNGIAVRADARAAAQLARLPGVQAVQRLLPKAPLNSRFVPAIGAPALWQGANGAGVTGEGITIAIIDTGIDYLHTDFGGPGVGYAENDPTVVGDVVGFPSAKIVGGFDFTGDDYNANPDQGGFNPVVTPDPDPMDCYPHGTSVAGTAAGYGVNQDGSTYAGPYGAGTDFGALRIGPGVAPEASLYALKVFGCAGSSEVVDQAVEWAVDPNGDGDLSDHVDVINLSLGSSYGSLLDMTAVAGENAAAMGVVVVAAAGNSGDDLYVVNSPSVGNQTISVAAADDVEVASFSARGPRRGDSALKPDLAAPGFGIFTAAAETGNAGRSISGTSLATPFVAGGMALLRQLYPDWSPVQLKALVMNTAVTPLSAGPALGDPRYGPVRIGAGRVSLTRAVAATALLANASAPALVSVSFGAPEVSGVTSAQKQIRITNLTSEPVTYTLAYVGVTDVPGVEFQLPVTTVTTPANGAALATVQFTADAATMRRTRDATLAATQPGGSRHWLSEESGWLYLWPPVARATITLTTEALVQLAYLPPQRTLAYTLTAASPMTITAGALQRVSDLGGEPIQPLFAGSVIVGPGQPLTGSALLNEQAVELLAGGQLAMLVEQAGEPEQPLAGAITLTPPPAATPLYAAPRPVADMGAISATLDLGNAAAVTQTLALTGTALTGSEPPTDVVSLVSVGELHATSPRLPVNTGELAQRGFADLHYVGVTSDLEATQRITDPVGALNGATLYFAIAVYEPWSSPNEVEFAIYIDANEDGVANFVLFNTSAAGYNGGNSNDVLMTALRDLRTGSTRLLEPLNGIEPTRFDTALYNSKVMILPVPAAMLALTVAQPAIRFWVESYSKDLSPDLAGERRQVDQTGVLRYDLMRPGLTFAAPGQQAPTLLDQPANAVLVMFVAQDYFASTAQGILLLHHHNRNALQSEVVTVESTWRARLFLPVVQDE